MTRRFPAHLQTVASRRADAIELLGAQTVLDKSIVLRGHP
jgi:hypothetical protein